MSNIFIILAGGINKRLNSKIPKPYIKINNKELLQYSIDAANSVKDINKILIIYNKKHLKFLKYKKFNKFIKIIGGKNRAESAYNALKKIKKYNCKNILIHDAARPNISAALIKKTLLSLKKNRTAIPSIKINDSTKIKRKSSIENMDRNKLYITQTPQGFRFKDIYNLNLKFFDKNINDDSSLYIDNKKKINLIKGDEDNFKITSNNDLVLFKKIKKQKNNFGIGYDIHKLELGRNLYLGGLLIPFHSGLKGHSDGDVIIHSLIDSILGACKLKDIGTLFSDKNSKFKNIRSTKLLKKVLNLIKLKGYEINNIDINVIAQKPKINIYRNKIINSISKLCNIYPKQINLKGKTTEKLGLIGKEKAIAAEVITSVSKYDE